ncbi:hypothetical protein ACFTTN_14210 [Streptomyces niveus]|uniref:hypothetical protein n=1 Tax=Streptomyces niveus TaxID=193462 RepID=UPI003639C2B9
MPTPDVVLKAIARALNGDTEGGLALIQPLVDAGPTSTYALLGDLADIASRRARTANREGHMFVFTVEGRDGEPVSVDDLPLPERFAGRFIAAWANGDADTAQALFWAAADHADINRTYDLADGISAVFDSAATVAGEVLAEKRRQKMGDPA